MTLTAPAFLLGLLGLALPVIAHFLGRQQPRIVTFAAMRFLPRAANPVSQRRTLRDRPLFLIRLLLLGLAVLLFTRPTTRAEGALRVVATVHDCVLLVDGSGSMALEEGGSREIERARARADAVLDALPPGSRVGLVTSDPDGPVIEPTADPERVRKALASWIDSGAPRWGGWTLLDALPSAVRLLPAASERPRFIYAIGDRSAGGLGPLPKVMDEIGILPIPTSDQGAPPHLGILSSGWEPAPELDPRAVRVRSVVRHAAEEDESAGEREATVVLRVGDEEIARTTVVLQPNRDTEVEFTPVLASEGPLAATVELVLDDPDPLPIDDSRALWVSAERAVEVLVINGDPSELRAHDEVYFLGTAIAAGHASGQGRISIRSQAPDQLEQQLRTRGKEALAGVDVLVLANVRAPSPDVARTLIEVVRGGMGLWITAGDRVEAAAYNELLLPLLPLRMRDAVQVGTAPGRTEALVEGLAPPVLTHPIFKGLKDARGLDGSRARKIVLLEPDPKRSHEVALSYTSGAPALLTAEYGSGRVAMLTTTIDRDWADLPLRPGFVPLVLGTLAFLSDAASDLPLKQILVGDALPLVGSQPVVVTTPEGRDLTVAPDAQGALQFTETSLPGHYRVRQNDTSATVFVVSVDPRESDTASSGIEGEPPAALQGERNFVAAPQWRTLVLFIMALLAIESALRWRTRESPARPGATTRPVGL